MQTKLNQIKVKILDPLKKEAKYKKIDLSELNLSLKTYSTETDRELIKKYYVSCFKNKKQPQHSNKESGRKKVEKPSGTNKGVSRQPRGTNGRSRIVVNVPNAVGGGKALPFNINSKSIKVNRKEKKSAIRLLIYYLLKKAKIYVIENNDTNMKDSEFLKFLKEYGNDSKLESFLKNPVSNVINSKKIKKKGLTIISESDSDPILKRFKNYKGNIHVLNDKKRNFFGVLTGYRYPFWVVTTEAAIKKFLKELYNDQI